MFRPSVMLLLLAVPVAALTMRKKQGDLQEDANVCNLNDHFKKPAPEVIEAIRKPPSARSQGEFQSPGIYVNSDANFAFCMIEKVACTKWSAVFSKLEKGDLSRNHPDYDVGKTSWSPEKAAQVFENPSATRAVFVRDPLERFLSAFLDKCMTHNCKDPNCPFGNWVPGTVPDFRDPHGVIKPFSAALDWVENEVKRDPNLDYINPHWKPQSRHCSLHERLGEWNTIGVMSADRDFGEDAACLLDRAGLSRLNTLGDAASTPFFGKRPKQIPLAGVPEKLDSHAYLKKFFTKDAAERLMNVFAMDYKLFDLPRPAWIDEATGEFFDKTDHLQCSRDGSLGTPWDPKPGENLKVWNMKRVFQEDDEDDIAVLARRAGYTL